MKKYSSLIFILFLSLPFRSTGQVIFDNFPKEMQLFSRNEKDSAFVKIKGKILNGAYKKIKIHFSIDNKLYKIFEQTDSLFEFSIPIKAQLKQYGFKAWAINGKDSLKVNEANKVLCGDAFIIYGQSNALSYAKYWVLNDSIQREYARNFSYFKDNSHVSDGWHDFTYPDDIGTMGKWICKAVIEKTGVPALFMNAAVGGVTLEYLSARNSEEPEELRRPYGVMLKRVKEAQIDRIKGFIFFQGESESHTNPSSVFTYPDIFRKFKSNIKLDFPIIDRFYIFQLPIFNLHNVWEAGLLRDYQRRFGYEFQDVTVVPTSGFGYWKFDGLHFGFEGFGIISDWLFKSYYSFQVNKTPFQFLDIKKVINDPVGKNLKLVFNKNITFQESANYGYQTVNLKDQFYVGRNSGYFDKIEAVKNVLFLSYNNLPEKKLTYLPGYFNDSQQKPYSGPYIFDDSGLPSYTFHDVNIYDELPQPELVNIASGNGKAIINLNSAVYQNLTGIDYEFRIRTNNPQPETIFKPVTDKSFQLSIDKSYTNYVIEIKAVSSNSESKSIFIDASNKLSPEVDLDQDGVMSYFDNCLSVKNPNQEDFDKDGQGDACDLDADGDLIADKNDNCLYYINPSAVKFNINGTLASFASSTNTNSYLWYLNDSLLVENKSKSLELTKLGLYKVQVKDNNGCLSELSNTVRLELLGKSLEESNIKIYPNPVSKRLFVRLPNNSFSRFELYNSTGQKLLSQEVKKEEFSIDLESYPAGKYIISFGGIKPIQNVSKTFIKIN